VVVAIVLLLMLFLMLGLTRQRESARLAGCQRNLMQIGRAIALYDHFQRHLPVVLAPLDAEGRGGTSPPLTVLSEFSVSDFSAIQDAKTAPPKDPNFDPAEHWVGAFLCPSDSLIDRTLIRAPTSYRATAGDSSDGYNGAFAPGRLISLAEIEGRDGTGFTAAFAERLLGTQHDGIPAIRNYALVRGPLHTQGCPEAGAAAWRGDAGKSWAAAGWQSTLYNHALAPNGAPSCIADDRRTAFIGASSGHVRGINVLICDGSVRLFTPTVDLKIWRDWARIEPPRPEE
jgi:type II secretory pathway pseudopilin PulG